MSKLSPEDQEIVREAGEPAVDAHAKEVLKTERADLALLQGKGIQFFQMENPKAFSDKVQVVYKNAAERIGADVIE